MCVLRTVRDELTCHPDNILLRNNNIVIPSSLRDDAVKLAHEGHQGTERTKAFIRSKVWFPGINDRVEKMVQKCHACNINHQGKINYEPLKMSKMPEKAWENLSMDLCGPLPSGDYLMVIVDEFSSYPIVEIIKSGSANTVIPVLVRHYHYLDTQNKLKLIMVAHLTLTNFQNLPNILVLSIDTLLLISQEQMLKQNHLSNH